MFTAKLSNSLKYILSILLVWRIGLFFVAYVSKYFYPKFAASYPYFDRVLTITNLPNWIWGWGGFDGVHYLRIAQNGYDSALYQAFFPLYPLIIRLFTQVNRLFVPLRFSINTEIFVDPAYFITGFLLANAFAIAATYLFYRWSKKNYGKIIAKKSLILLLLFPTSFYLVSVYTEGLFIMLAVLVFLLTEKKKYLLAGLVAGIASLTRITGALLFIYLLIDLWPEVRNRNLDKTKYLLVLMLSLSGLFIYSFYLHQYHNDPLAFLSVQKDFGAQRSALPIVTLPQVYYRYFKILLSIPAFTHSTFIILVELAFSFFGLFLLALSYKKVSWGIWMFCLLAFLFPTLTGTFSSLPRYSLALFPLFPFLVERIGKHYKPFVFLSALFLFILAGLFIRGYWVS